MKPSSAKAKGRRLCKAIQAMILHHCPELKEDDVIVRSSGSNGEDVILSPKAKGLLPLAIECKNTERLDIWKAIRQAESHREIKRLESLYPAVIFSRNHADAYLTLKFTDFLKILGLYCSMTEHPAEALDRVTPTPESAGEGH